MIDSSLLNLYSFSTGHLFEFVIVFVVVSSRRSVLSPDDSRRPVSCSLTGGLLLAMLLDWVQVALSVVDVGALAILFLDLQQVMTFFDDDSESMCESDTFFIKNMTF